MWPLSCPPPPLLTPPTCVAAVTKLTGMHADRVKRTLTDSSELEMSIDALTRDITSQFGWAGRKLKTIASSSSTVEGKKSSDASIRVNIQRSLATKLQGMSGAFRKAQRRSLADVNRRKDASSLDTLLGTSGAASSAAAADPDDVDTVRPAPGASRSARRAPGSASSAASPRPGIRNVRRPAASHPPPLAATLV